MPKISTSWGKEVRLETNEKAELDALHNWMPSIIGSPPLLADPDFDHVTPR
jgi:hypothetical protein